MITKRELVQDNIVAFGHRDAAVIARKQKIPFAIFYFLAFGKIPPARITPPCNSSDLIKGRNSTLRIAQYGAWLNRLGHSLSAR